MTDRDTPIDAALALSLAHLPRHARPAAEAVYALDARLARIAASTTEPVLGQMRLAWWAEALASLDRSPPGAEPVLRALASAAVMGGMSGATLAALTDPWEVVIDPDATIDARMCALEERGRGVLSIVAQLLTVEAPGVRNAGGAWGLGSALPMARSPDEKHAFEASAEARLRDAMRFAWPRRARALALPALAVAERGGGASTSLRLAGFLLFGSNPLSRTSRPI